MTQLQLDRAVASRTGESLDTVRALGFNLLPEPDDGDFDSVQDDGYCLDCPGCGAAVVLTHGPLETLPEFAECYRCDCVYPYAPHEVYDSALAVCA